MLSGEGKESPRNGIINYWRKGKGGVIYLLKNVPFLIESAKTIA
jgi:hypothetical protein